MISVELFKSDEGELFASEDFSWNLIDYKETKMSIQLTFDEPLTISNKYLDEIRVTFKDTNLMYDEFGQELEAESFLQKEIPPQYANAAEAKVFDSLKEVS